MTVYLIKEENELQIHRINPEQEIRFLGENGDKILLWGDSIKDVLRKFKALLVIISS